MLDWSFNNNLTNDDSHLSSIECYQFKLELEKQNIFKKYLKII